MKTSYLFKRLSLAVVFSFSVLAMYSQSAEIDPLATLREGNERFISSKTIHPHQDMATVEALKAGQKPFAIIVSCSDSRVTPELVFDQGLGDLFSIRTAGNVMSDYEEGSIEYAAEHLGTKLIVVMGHQGCGAVKAFLDYAEDRDNERNHHGNGANEHSEIAGHIKAIVDKMASEEEENEVLAEEGEHYEKAVIANVINGVKQLRKSDPILAKMYKEGKVNIVGAVYRIDNGKVEFLDF